MKNITKFAGIVTIAFTLTQTLQATSISGSIGFEANPSATSAGVVFDTSSAGTAAAVVQWINPIVSGTSGSFTSVANGTSALFSSSTWYFNSATAPAGSFPINSFWTVGGFTFNLLSSYVLAQGGTAGVNAYVVVNGTGIVSGNGYTPTTLSWSFTSQDPAAGSNPTSWTFSASANSVPDGGATVMLLGIALSGVALLKKKFTA